jgi:hypothetical protein
VAKLNLKGLAAGVNDSLIAVQSTSKGPADLSTLAAIKAALAPVRGTLPPAYRAPFYDQLMAATNSLTPGDFKWLQDHPNNTPFWDAVQAVLQNASGFESKATDAFQEVVGDLYDGFLSAEDRVGVKLPDYEVIPPLVKWGSPDFGPYTWPVDAMLGLKIPIGVVNLPPSHARGGLLGWSTIGHETGGHDILSADEGLLKEIAAVTNAAVRKAGLPQWMADYWSERIDETASDVLGLINMGPAAGIGLIGYFRGLRGASGPTVMLSDGPADDPHPADVVRGYLAASTVRLLSFTGKAAWAEAIETETDKDVTNITLVGQSVSRATAKKAVAAVARAIADTKLVTLEKRSLRSIQDWANEDEAITATLQAELVKGKTVVPAAIVDTSYATHVVAAAVYAVVLGQATPANVFKAMVGMLKAMHDDNPSWGPLFVGHRGDTAKHLIAIKR